MGPTLQYQSAPISPPDCSTSSQQNQDNVALEHNRGTLRKLQVPVYCPEKQADGIRFVLSIVNKLTKVPVSTPALVHFERAGFEGPLAEEYNKRFEIESDAVNLETKDENFSSEVNMEQNYLTVFVEQYQFQSLKEWLEDRQNDKVHLLQVHHIVIQLLSAVNHLMECDITEIHENLSLENIHVICGNDSQVEDYLPELKFAFLNVQNILDNSSDSASQKVFQCPDFVQIVASMWLELLQNCTKNEFPDELKLINELKAFNKLNLSTTCIANIITKIKDLSKADYEPILLNLNQSTKHFIGRVEELQRIESLINMKHELKECKENIINVYGPLGSGKTELVSQLSHDLLNKGFNILRLNAASPDSLTRTICGCAAHKKILLDTKDYTGSAKGLDKICQELLRFFQERRLLLIIENVDESSSEAFELVEAFVENLKSDKSLYSNHYLLLVTDEACWSSTTSLQHATKVQLKEFNDVESHLYLEEMLSPSRLQTLQDLLHMQDNMPASLKLIVSLVEYFTEDMCESLMKTVRRFLDKYSHVGNTLPSTSLIYTMSLCKLYDTLSEAEKPIAREILNILRHSDGISGMRTDTLNVILQETLKENNFSAILISQILELLARSGLIQLKNKAILLSSWMQCSLKTAFQLLFSKEQSTRTFKQRVLSAIKNIISSKSSEINRWEVVPHAAYIWTNICQRDKILAKEFDYIPELIIDLARKEDRLECVIGFVKEASDILTSDSSETSSYDYRVLKLNFVLAKDHLLPQSRRNEAFTIFKIIQEESATEPRDFLMLKLKALIELGQIHIVRRDFEKAISCFQQVQILAVQKISTVELDSEPTVLRARMMHGYTYLEQGNLEEGKKILLQVIPLLERYTGLEATHVWSLLIQAKFYLATLLRQSGDLVNALMMQKKILKEREKALGGKHPDTWASKREMALLYSAYDNQEKALVILRGLLEVQEEILGAPSNRQSLATMNAVAEIEAKLGNFDDALELYEAIDLIEQQVLCENDEMRISSQLNQAEVLMSLGQYKEASDIFELIFTLKSTSENKTSQDIALCESILSKREKAGRSMEILGNYWLSLSPENVDEPAELSALGKKHEVATELAENQDYHGALRFLREVLEDCGHLDEVNRFHLNVKADMARILGLVGKFNESFSFYKDIIPLMDSTFGETDELTMLCKDTMAQVFLFSGNQFLKRQMSNLKWFLF